MWTCRSVEFGGRIKLWGGGWTEQGRHVRFLLDGRGLYPGGGSPFDLDVASWRFCRPTMFVIRPTMFVIGIVAVPSVICTRYALGLLNEEDSAIRMETLFQPWTRWFFKTDQRISRWQCFCPSGFFWLWNFCPEMLH